MRSVESRLEDIVKWMRENALHTGSHRFFGEGEDIDYVVRFGDVLRMERYFPYTAQLLTTGEINSSMLDKEYTDSFLSVKYDLKGQMYNFIVTSNEEFNVWKYATDKLLECLPNDKLRDKKARVSLFEKFKQEARG